MCLGAAVRYAIYTTHFRWHVYVRTFFLRFLLVGSFLNPESPSLRVLHALN